MAAVIASRLAKFVNQSLGLSPSSTTVHLWSDSQITLHWIYDLKQANATKPFITNRVSEITQAFPASVWTYVPTDNNPADLLTRGVSAEQFERFPTLASWPLLVALYTPVAHMVTS